MTALIHRLSCIALAFGFMVPTVAWAQYEQQQKIWNDLRAQDAAFARSATEDGRTEAFLAVLAPGSVVFREGPVDARELYELNEYQYRLDQLTWGTHFIDVSLAGDMGVAVGPSRFTPSDGDAETGGDTFGFKVGVWVKQDDAWKMMAFMIVRIPGFMDLDGEPEFSDTIEVLRESAHPVLSRDIELQSLIEADNLFGQSINFRGGQRARLRYGLENQRLYVGGMAPAIGAEAAAAAYDRFLDEYLSSTRPVSVQYMGGQLAESRDVGFTYGVMFSEGTDTEPAFRANYLRFWRYAQSNEWRISLEVINPF